MSIGYTPYNLDEPILPELLTSSNFIGKVEKLEGRLLGVNFIYKLRESVDGAEKYYSVMVVLGGVPNRPYSTNEEFNASDYEFPVTSLSKKVKDAVELQSLIDNEIRSIEAFIPHIVLIINGKIRLTPSNLRTIDAIFNFK